MSETTTIQEPDWSEVDRIIENALREDVTGDDVTTNLLFFTGRSRHGRLPQQIAGRPCRPECRKPRIPEN
ncbi:MAG: hypothetical protein M5U15_02615 [Kiritimatiellae bacterium]|nr:hypothetical protein [Kiritimatiellia bacterium]